MTKSKIYSSWTPILAILSLFAIFPFATSQPTIPQDQFRYAVMIDVEGNFPASGFFLRDSLRFFLVTAKHVLLDSSGKLLKPKCTVTGQHNDPNEPGQALFQLDLSKLDSLGKIHPIPAMDIVCVRIAGVDQRTREMVVPKEVWIRSRSKSGVTVIPTGGTLPISKVFPGNQTFVLGYPSSIGLAEVEQFDHTKPLVRQGIVAAVESRKGTIVLQCQVYYGDSGSPVMQLVNSGSSASLPIIGIISQWIPFDERYSNKGLKLGIPLLANSGYSIVVSLDKLLEMLHEF